MRISDWSSDVCSSDLPAGLRKEVSFADVQSDPAATILVRPTIRHDTRRQGELRCNAQLIEQVAGANEFSLREKRSRILQPPPRSFVFFIVERTRFSRKRDHADHTRGDRQSANKCPPFHLAPSKLRANRAQRNDQVRGGEVTPCKLLFE